MKIAIIGGAGVRTPLLVGGLTGSDLPIDEIALYDIDRDRLGDIAALADRYRGAARLRVCAAAVECLEGAHYIFLSLRVGGIAARARDEATSVAHGIAGQETVGPGGFAMAMRTIPPALQYARQIERIAPRAWIINFTNPVGIVTQAVRAETGARIVGICDTPTELIDEVARELGLSAATCHFDYFGLNHLGWLREVYHRGEPQLGRLWDDPSALQRIYRAPLFDAAFLRELRLLPTEYLYYYYRPSQALENIRRAGTTRGEGIERLNDRLFRDLRAPGADLARIYEAYLAARNDGYMRIESGSGVPGAGSGVRGAGPPPSPEASAGRRSLGGGGGVRGSGSETRGSGAGGGTPRGELTGYDRIALAVVRAIQFDSGAIIPLNVSNRGAIDGLENEDVVEVPCMVTAEGARPLRVGPAPEQVRDLLLQVKEYERLTVRASIARSLDLAVTALARNPLVSDAALSRRLIDALSPSC